MARALTDAGYRTSGNRGQNPFTKDTVLPLLQNRFYLGELPDENGGWLPAKHGALIDPSLFAAAERTRRANLRLPRQVSLVRTPWALSSLAVCGSCGSPLRMGGMSDGRTRRVWCAGRTQGCGCDEPSFYASVVEDQLAAFL